MPKHTNLGGKASAYNSGYLVLSPAKLSNNQAGKFHDTELYTSVKCKPNTAKIVHRVFLLWVYESCREMQKTLRTVLQGERGNMAQGSSSARV